MAKRGKITVRHWKIDRTAISIRQPSEEDLIKVNLFRLPSSTRPSMSRVNLGVNPRHADQMVRGAVVYPNGLGKAVKVAVFAKGEKATEAKAAGADIVGDMDLGHEDQGRGLSRLRQGDRHARHDGRCWSYRSHSRSTWSDAQSEGRYCDLQRCEGRREMKAGRVEFRVDKAGVVHAPIGKVSFEVDALGCKLVCTGGNALTS